MPPGPVRVTSLTSSRPQQLLHLGQLLLPANEGSGLQREVVGAVVQRLEGWELRRQASHHKLEDMLRPGEVLEAVLSHVEQAHPGG